MPRQMDEGGHVVGHDLTIFYLIGVDYALLQSQHWRSD